MTAPGTNETEPHAPPRTYGWVARRVRAWLGIDHHERITIEHRFALKDHETTLGSHLTNLEEHRRLVNQIAPQMQFVTTTISSLDRRLAHYEVHVPRLRKEKQILDAEAKR